MTNSTYHIASKYTPSRLSEDVSDAHLLPLGPGVGASGADTPGDGGAPGPGLVPGPPPGSRGRAVQQRAPGACRGHVISVPPHRARAGQSVRDLEDKE